MGNIGLAAGKSRSRSTAKVMTINGETRKVKTPIQAVEITKNHPAGHVLLDSEAVKHYGLRAKPLDPNQNLEPKKLYFLVELPKFPKQQQTMRGPRRVRSGGMHVSAKDRLEGLMLSRRSASDLSSIMKARAGRNIMKQEEIIVLEEEEKEEYLAGSTSNGGPIRVRIKLPRGEVERLIRESKTEAEAAEKIIDLSSLYTTSNNNNNNVEKYGFMKSKVKDVSSWSKDKEVATASDVVRFSNL